MIKKQSEFIQTRYNEAKLGAYFTDQEHCRWLSNFFEFQEETCCLDPAIGDGQGILTVTGKKDNKIKVYGVELNMDTYEKVSKNPDIDQCIHADFLTDVIVSHNSFSFAFVNPPYGVIEKLGENCRQEMEFLRKLPSYLTKDAVVVYVIPQYVCAEKSFLRQWSNSFETQFLFRFHEEEYAKYKQVVLIGRKREKTDQKEEASRDDVLKLFETVALVDNIPLLPENYDGEKLKIAKSMESNIEKFMTLTFHAEEAAACITKSPLLGMVREKAKTPSYKIDNLARPPIMPSAGHMYLLAISGAGQGLVGSTENKDVHLQRGVAKITTRMEYVKDEQGNDKLVETSYPQIQYVLIENSGKMTSLQ